MPVRIYDIAKKLGIENKLVLSKAKELGITTARVPSSSLDKITAEYLENQLAVLYPPKPAAPPPEVIKAPAAPAEAPAVAPAPATEPVPTVAPHVPVAAEPPPVAVEPPPVLVVTSTALAPPDAVEMAPPAPVAEAPPAAAPRVEVPPAPPMPPAPPPPPKVGDLVGRIQLPVRPSARGTERGPAKGPPRPAPPSRPEPVRGRQDSRAGMPAGPRAQAPAARTGPPTPGGPAAPKYVAPVTGELITLKPPVIVRDLAEKLNRKPFQLIADLIELKVMANVNQAVDEKVAQQLCAKYGFRFEVEKRERGAGVHAVRKQIDLDPEDKLEELQARAPVVTIMGHVDHGKTTLLDVIRQSNVAAGEAGGITQHIGAYTISFPHPEKKGELRQITFLDTPGHAAFSAMRARGANVTDIVVLVVAANDGVMPQTLEALSHAQAARVPIIVAVNKTDHPNANPMKVRQQLQDRGLTPDDWGGNTIYCDVSALTKQGVDHLLEMILLQADLLELKANPKRRAKGNVIESGLAPGGPTATVLVRKGTLRLGDAVLCGQFYGKVRALISEEGERLKEAGPSVAVKLLGLNGVPVAGDEFSVVEGEKAARATATERTMAARALVKEAKPKATLEDLFGRMDPTSKLLRVVVKADTQGSEEAIVDALKKVDSEKVSLEVIHSAVGTITENDVLLASASKAIILGFHTRIDNSVPEIAKREGVQIKLYTIIYELIDEVKLAMAGLLEPILKENVIGVALVRKVFELSKGGKVAGCVLESGRIVRGKVRVKRRRETLYEGNILSLRRFQDEVNEVRAGMECGIRLEGFNDFQEGDTIEAYSIEKIAPQL